MGFYHTMLLFLKPFLDNCVILSFITQWPSSIWLELPNRVANWLPQAVTPVTVITLISMYACIWFLQQGLSNRNNNYREVLYTLLQPYHQHSISIPFYIEIAQYPCKQDSLMLSWMEVLMSQFPAQLFCQCWLNKNQFPEENTLQSGPTKYCTPRKTRTAPKGASHMKCLVTFQ